MPRAGLTTEVVVETAARLVDEDGWEQLSFANLAERLHVKPPSLYEHVAGLEGLREALRLRGLRFMESRFRRALTGRSGDAAVLALANEFRNFVREHPALYRATLKNPEKSSVEIQKTTSEILGIIYAVLESYGIRDEEAVHATRYLRSVLHGFSSLEAAGGFGLPTDVDESYRRAVQILTFDLKRWTHQKE